MITFVIIFLVTLAQFILIWIPCWVQLVEYTDEDGLIWVSPNREISWYVTHFLPFIALTYEKLCETINGQGLLIVIYLLYIISSPMSLFFTLIGLLVCCVRYAWRKFCYAYRRN